MIGGTAAVMPIAARAQQQMPRLGFLGSGAPEPFANYLASFQKGLEEAGFVEGRTIAIEYRWARNQYDRLPALAAELVERKVDVIAAIGGNAMPQAAKQATATIPIVFTLGYDPVEAGLVPSLNRPGGNVTGVTFFDSSLVAKRIALLHEWSPPCRVAILTGRGSPEMKAMAPIAKDAAGKLGLALQIVEVASESEITAAFDKFAAEHVGGAVTGSDPIFVQIGRRVPEESARHAIPTISNNSDLVRLGELAG